MIVVRLWHPQHDVAAKPQHFATTMPKCHVCGRFCILFQPYAHHAGLAQHASHRHSALGSDAYLR
jgi:hypothetical protein